ncbi:MAG TPA: BMP family protein [Gemmatimonadales bacterium]|jgi:basic membrane lipoprotein Med (substrate-binding protein (PBP1-ABC) superfamily)
MTQSRWLIVLVVALGCARRGPPKSAFRVALITPGSIADAAWNAGAYRGLQQLRDSLGASISNIEATTPAEQEEALRSYAAEGYTIVFGHGYEFQEPAERVARDYPNTIFVITSGERLTGRVVPLIFRIHEATYLAGMIAGAMTRTGKIGFIGGMELPPIKLGYDGWIQGARATRPDVESRITYLNTFDDASAGKEAALAMIHLGVDQIHHNADAAALGVFAAARESPGVFVYGANGDQTSLAPDRVVASAVVDLARALMLVGREVKTGAFTPHAESFGIKSGVIRLAVNPALQGAWPAGLEERVAAASDSIAAGTLHVAGQGTP